MISVRKEEGLSVEICGLRFKNPFILASGPPTGNGEMLRRAFEEGWAGAVIKTVTLDPEGCKNVTPAIWGIFCEDKLIGLSNIEAGSTQSLDKWASDIGGIKSQFDDRVIIGSLMHTQGLQEENWARAAKACLEAGVDALELNFSCPHLLAEWGVGSSIGEDPKISSMVVDWLRKVVDIPIIVKLPAFIPDLPSVCRAVKESGADAISTTNTIQALNVDIERKAIHPNVRGKGAYSGYSGVGIKPIGLRNVAKIAQTVELPVIGIGGISTWSDVIEYLMVGASAVEICTAVMLHGYRIVHELRDGVSHYMSRQGFLTISEMVGFLLPQISPYDHLDRSSKVVSTIASDKCIKDGLCYVACKDGSSGAIELDQSRMPRVNEEKCRGCSLCMHVCPVTGCIEMKPVTEGAKIG